MTMTDPHWELEIRLAEARRLAIDNGRYISSELVETFAGDNPIIVAACRTDLIEIARKFSPSPDPEILVLRALELMLSRIGRGQQAWFGTVA